MKFKSRDEELNAKAILEEGKKTQFWKLVVDSLMESKEFIQEQQDGEDISELSAEQYKHMNEVFKAKKKFLDILTKTPDNIISWLEKPVNERKEFDPYDK